MNYLREILLLDSGEIKSGIPSFQVPPFSFERPSSSNRTNLDAVMNTTETVSFQAILADLGTGLAMVPIIGLYFLQLKS